MQRHTERQLVRVMNCCTLRRTKPGGSNHRQPGLCGLSRYSSNDHRLTSMQSLETDSCGLVSTGLHRFRTPCFSPAGQKPHTSWPLLSPSDLISSLWSHWRCEGLRKQLLQHIPLTRPGIPGNIPLPRLYQKLQGLFSPSGCAGQHAETKQLRQALLHKTPSIQNRAATQIFPEDHRPQSTQTCSADKLTQTFARFN